MIRTMLPVQFNCLLFGVTRDCVLDLPQMGKRSKEWAGHIADRGEVTALDDDREYVEQHRESKQLKGANGSWPSVKHATGDGWEQNSCRGRFVREGAAEVDAVRCWSWTSRGEENDSGRNMYNCAANERDR
jgi:hypothetical protein